MISGKKKPTLIINWIRWTASISVASPPKLTVQKDKELEKLKYWLQSRTWSKRYKTLEDAFENFRLILEDFYQTFHRHSESPESRDFFIRTEKFYHIKPHNYELYDKLLIEGRPLISMNILSCWSFRARVLLRLPGCPMRYVLMRPPQLISWSARVSFIGRASRADIRTESPPTLRSTRLMSLW